MKTALLILVLILGGASSLYARFKRTLAEDGNAADGSETQSYAGEEAGDDFFDLDRFELENDETAPAKPDEYFTYEAPKVEVKTKPVEVKGADDSVQPVLQVFDLRQAVVYQTLLNNPYITQ